MLKISAQGIFIPAYLGVWTGVLFFPGVLGVDMAARLVDLGVFCFPALPGVLWVLAREVTKSLFIPLCLDVVLHVWQVAIWDKERKGKYSLILHARHQYSSHTKQGLGWMYVSPYTYFWKQFCKVSTKVTETSRIIPIYQLMPFSDDFHQPQLSHSCLSLSGTHRSLLWLWTSAAVTGGHRKQEKHGW